MLYEVITQEFRLHGNVESCNTKQSAPKRMNLEQLNISKDKFLPFLNSLIDKTMRIKGYYKLDNSYYYLGNNNGIIV